MVRLGCLLLLSASATGRPQKEHGTPPHIEELFLANCASCHGVRGDGDGTAELDRRARSFRDGGFSYGNTVEAILRTVSNGIPGTPMPAFGEALSEADLTGLARHVQSLGPAIREVTSEDATLRIAERPQVLRGMLPAIHDGALAHTRGLLLGTPSGWTFEYRADDVRLLGLRLGEFARRTDWSGRGGTALEPLGQVVHLVADGRPPAPFALRADLTQEPRPLVARLAGTFVESAPDGSHAVGLRYRLEDAEGAGVGTVREDVGGLAEGGPRGFRRRFTLEPLPGRGSPEARMGFVPSPVGEDEILEEVLLPTGSAWCVIRRGPDLVECIGFKARTPYARSRATLGRFETRWEADTPITFELVTLLLREWNEPTRATIVEFPW